MRTSRRQFLKTTCLAVGAGLVLTTRAFAKKKAKVQWDDIKPLSYVVCPVCGTPTLRNIHLEGPLHIFHCPVCLTWLKPKNGDLSIFESYGTVPSVETQTKQKRQRGEKLPNVGLDLDFDSIDLTIGIGLGS